MTVLLVLMNNRSRGERLERGGFTWEEGNYVVLLVEVVNFKGHMLGCDDVSVIVSNLDSNKFCNQLGLYDISCASSVVGQRMRIGYSKKKMCVLIKSDIGLRTEGVLQHKASIVCIRLVINECS